MSWRVYQLNFRLRSPLHAGYQKVGNLQRTRRYVPAQTVIGAITARLVAALDLKCYAAPRRFVVNNLVVSYLFPAEQENLPVRPWYHETRGLIYTTAFTDDDAACGLTPAAFDHRYISSATSTALDQQSAHEGSLHEIEYLSPVTADGKPVLLVGKLFVPAESWTAEEIVATPEENDVQLSANGKTCSLMGDVLHGMQVGGERRYGFGRLELPPFVSSGLSTAHGDRPRLTINRDKPFPVHVAIESAAAKPGVVEPLVGRRTKDSEKFGQDLSAAQICWAPGSCATEELALEFIPDQEIWGKVAKR